MAQPALIKNEPLTREISLDDIGNFIRCTGDPNPIHKEAVEPHKAVVVPGLFLVSQFLLSLNPEDAYAFRFNFVDFAYPGNISIYFEHEKNKYIIENTAKISGETLACVEVMPLEPKDADAVSRDKEAEFSISPKDFWEKIKIYCFHFDKQIPTAKAVYPFVASLFPNYFARYSDLGREVVERKSPAIIKGLELRVYKPLFEIPKTAELTYYKPKWTMGVPRVLLEARLPDNKPNDPPFMSVSISLPRKD